MQNETIRHYELLIEEDNDPVRDPEPLRAYMDGWDGKAFLQALCLDGSQSVLEIGVGTGRLALRIAPGCRSFTGVDISPGTIRRAAENLADLRNVRLLCGDFMTADLSGSFDVICASLTFLHIREKAQAIRKIASLLVPGGRTVLSLDKNQSTLLDYGTRRLTVYPDDPAAITGHMEAAGLTVLPVITTEFANIVIGVKV